MIRADHKKWAPTLRRTCQQCGYFRQVERVRRNRTFCALTGEALRDESDLTGCAFWTSAGVAHGN
jgi:hypothetical protein